MSLISQVQLDAVREATDLVRLISEHVALKKAGRNFKGLCPFHQEKTPSFIVSPEKQIFHCFGCHAGGDAFSFLEKVEGISFVDAVAQLAELAGIKLDLKGGTGDAEQAHTKKLLRRVNRIAAEFFFNCLQDETLGQKARDYLASRQITVETAGHYLLGYAPEASGSLTAHLQECKVPLALAERAGLVRMGRDGTHYDFFRERLIFPIRNRRGDFVGFSGRTLAGQDPKYLNSPDSPVYQKRRELYGLFEALAATREEKRALIAEGNLDVLALNQAGFKAVMAPLGTALTEEQIRGLAKLVEEIVLVFDGDAAGEKAAIQALTHLLPTGLMARLVVLPAGEDPASLLGQGKKRDFEEQLSSASGLLDYVTSRRVAEAGGDTVKRGKLVGLLIPLLAQLPGEVEKNLYIQRLAEKSGLGEEGIRAELIRFQKAPRNFSPRPAETNDAERHRPARLSPAERDLVRAAFSRDPVAEALRQELASSDFSHPELQRHWETIKGAGGLKLTELVAGLQDPELKDLVAGLVLEEEAPIGDEGIDQCRRALRQRRWEQRQKELTQQIRQAEVTRDLKTIETLVAEKNQLLQEMRQEG